MAPEGIIVITTMTIIITIIVTIITAITTVITIVIVIKIATMRGENDLSFKF